MMCRTFLPNTLQKNGQLLLQGGSCLRKNRVGPSLMDAVMNVMAEHEKKKFRRAFKSLLGDAWKSIVEESPKYHFILEHITANKLDYSRTNVKYAVIQWINSKLQEPSSSVAEES